MDFEGIYCFDIASVRLAVYPDGPGGARIVAQISEDTLHDAFGSREIGEELIQACKVHFDAIAAATIAPHKAHPRQPVMLMSDDFGHHLFFAPPTVQRKPRAPGCTPGAVPAGGARAVLRQAEATKTLPVACRALA
jgi:hypothetical protein